jgi:hypothetical protein
MTLWNHIPETKGQYIPSRPPNSSSMYLLRSRAASTGGENRSVHPRFPTQFLEADKAGKADQKQRGLQKVRQAPRHPLGRRSNNAITLDYRALHSSLP